MTDRSTRKLSRAELESELMRMQQQVALFNKSEAIAHVGHFEWNATSRCLESCSREFAAIFGLTVKGALDPQSGMEKILACIYPEDRERYQALYDAPCNSGLPDIEFRILRDEGELRSLHQVGIEPRQSLDGDTILPGILRDVTAPAGSGAVHEYQNSLALQAEQISAIGNFIYDEIEDRYVYTSPGCARIYGLTEAEYLHSVESVEEDLADIYGPDRDRVHEDYVRYFNSGADCQVEFRIYHADGELRWIRELLVALEMKNGRVALTRGVLQDITEQKNIEMELRAAKQDLEILVAERTSELASTVSQLKDEIQEREKISAELEFLANHDPLTGLPSLRLCKDRLEHALAESRRSGQMTAILFLDLDGFKAINDRFGHEHGDKVLKTSAGRIKSEIRETDTVARIGGDEFLVILSGLPDLSIVERIASKLIQQVAQTISVEQHEVAVSASIGIAIYPDDAKDGEELIRIADQAMYTVKHSGKNSFGFLQPSKFN